MRAIGFGGLYPGMVGMSRGRRKAGVAWTVDATSGIAVPANATEWSAFIAAKGLSVAVPDALWLFQDAGGNAADAIGSFTLTASGTGLAYQQALTGWARKAITLTDGNTGQFQSISASLPDISTSSQFTVLLAAITAPSTLRAIITQGTTTTAGFKATIAPNLRLYSGANFAGGSETFSGVQPLGLRSNATATTTTGFTDAVKMNPTYGSPAGKSILFGGSPNLAMSVPYGFEWHGANAEITDASYKSLLQAMGFTISWT